MKKRFWERLGLSVLFSMVMLYILLITAIIVGGIYFFLVARGPLSLGQYSRPLFPVVVVLIASVLVGTLVSYFLSRFPLRPLRNVIRATNRLAAGDFSVRLNLNWSPEAAELSQSFNRMAQELGNTELLRSDFVNSFSHEFKTPIVSIKGFAEMLKYGDLSPEEREEYLDIIIRESGRLSTLATNVLALTKVEKQTIVTDKSRFNAGEQIRRSLILLQQKWEEKELEVALEGEDIFLWGNEEMLDQVWLNLLDNAVKFAPRGAQVEIRMIRLEQTAQFMFRNQGEAVRPEILERVFDKFYQGDPSHAAAGNGLGLTLVRRITELHGGSVTARSDDSGTCFAVELPLKAPEETNGDLKQKRLP